MKNDTDGIFTMCVIGTIICLMVLVGCKNSNPSPIEDNFNVAMELAESARVPIPDEYHAAYILDYTSKGMRCLYIINKYDSSNVNASCVSVAQEAK